MDGELDNKLDDELNSWQNSIGRVLGSFAECLVPSFFWCTPLLHGMRAHPLRPAYIIDDLHKTYGPLIAKNMKW